jgi:hypothetical protein
MSGPSARSQKVYYRIANQRDASSCWEWESRVIASLEVLFRILRMYRSVPGYHLRVFFSSSVEGLELMLARENTGLPSNSITAEQLLNGSKTIRAPEMRQLELELHPTKSMGMGVPALLSEQPLDEQHTRSPFDERRMGFLDMRRLEVELGAGGGS